MMGLLLLWNFELSANTVVFKGTLLKGVEGSGNIGKRCHDSRILRGGCEYFIVFSCSLLATLRYLDSQSIPTRQSPRHFGQGKVPCTDTDTHPLPEPEATVYDRSKLLLPPAIPRTESNCPSPAPSQRFQHRRPTPDIRTICPIRWFPFPLFLLYHRNNVRRSLLATRPPDMPDPPCMSYSPSTKQPRSILNP